MCAYEVCALAYAGFRQLKQLVTQCFISPADSGIRLAGGAEILFAFAILLVNLRPGRRHEYLRVIAVLLRR